MKQKVVVFGGSGFFGSHLADALTDKGYDVTIFDLQTSRWLRSSQKMIIGDIRDETLVNQALAETDYVYHLAGIADIAQAAVNPKDTVEHNIIGSTVVLEACRCNHIKRILFASTVYVYSQHGSFYRVCKQAVEHLIDAYYEKFGLEYTILRFGSLYGPRAQDSNGLKRYVTQAVNEGRIVYPGTGDVRREYIHVKDAANLSIEALAPAYANQCLNLTGAQVLNSRELLHMIREIMGGQIELIFEPENQDPAHYEMTPYRFTPSVARKMVPSVFVDIGQGILDLVEESFHRQNDTNTKS